MRYGRLFSLRRRLTRSYTPYRNSTSNSPRRLFTSVRPTANATLFRISLNTLENPNLVATGIAIGGTEGVNHPFPFGANVSAPAQYFLTVHGETAVLTDAASGAVVSGPAPAVSVDM